MHKYPSFPILLHDREKHARTVETALEVLGISNMIRCGNRYFQLSLVEDHRPGIILLDIGDPAKSDEEILEEIVRRFPRITVIVTGENEAATAVRCMKKGASDYLAKPISHEAFESCIRHAIEVQELHRRNIGSVVSDKLRRMTDSAQQTAHKMISLGRIWIGIAHEIRNPLSAINIYLKMLRELFTGEGEYSEEEVAEVMTELQSASDRIERIVRKVLDFSKPHAPNMVLSDVNQCITESVDLARVTLWKEGITMKIALGQNIPECILETRSVSQIILNLLTNAADAMKDIEKPKTILITSSRDEDHVIIKVSDPGPGVIPKDRERIFEPFFTTKPGGLGIGLSICNRIIRDHGGYISVGESGMGGAEFQICIPISKKGKTSD